LEGWSIPQVAPDPEFRRCLEEKAARGGGDELYQDLLMVDPVAGQRIDRRNIRRVIRALEVHRSTDSPFSQLPDNKIPPFDTLVLGLTAERNELYHRVDQRVDQMIERGLVEEVKNLANMGYGFELPSMSGIGYRQIGLFLRGEVTLPSAIQQIKFETHRLVRHQYAWFKLTDRRIKWFDIGHQPDSEIAALIAKFVRSGQRERRIKGVRSP